MADHTHIEWTDATWNPVTGCSVVSPGCANCYAMRLAGTRLQYHPSRAGLTAPSKAGPVWNGEVRLNADWLTQPLAWKRPRRIFVAAHGDLFHEAVPDAWIDQVFAVMALAAHHTFQVLTKRAARMRSYFADPRCRSDAIFEAAIETDPRVNASVPLPNVWLGVSAEDQVRADERIPDLLATPAAGRFLSAEPLLGPIDLRAPLYRGEGGVTMRAYVRDAAEPDDFHHFASKLDWVIAGGESGPGARPMHPDWPRQLRDACAAARIPFFFKQWGEWAPDTGPPPRHDTLRTAAWLGDGDHVHPAARNHWSFELDDVARAPSYDDVLLRYGKKAAGRLLDGVTHSAFPQLPLIPAKAGT